jgi:flagellin-like hook-associated protein FlgL
LTIFTVNASASTDLEDSTALLEVRWDWEDDGTWDTAWSTTKTDGHLYVSPGTYTIRLEVRDTGGLTDQAIAQVLVDGAAPATTAILSGTLGLNGWYTSPVFVTLTATDDLTGVASTTYRIDGGAWQTYAGPFVEATDGVHTVEFFSTDMVGNAEAPQSTTVWIDSETPTTSASFSGTAGDNGWYVSDVTVTLSASDLTSGVDTITYRLDGGSWQTYVVPSVVGEGQHLLEYQATDMAGNSETLQSVPVKVDTTPPVLTLTSPTEGTTFDVPTVLVSGTTEPGVLLTVNGFVVTVAADGTFSVLLALSEGSNTITATATDDAGNTATDSVTVTHANPLTALEQQLQQALDELNATRDELATIQDELNLTRDDLAAMQAELNATQDALAAVQTDLVAMQTDLATALNDLNATQETLAAIQTQLADTQQQLEDFRSESGAAKEEQDAANARLADLNSQGVLLILLLMVVLAFTLLQFLLYLGMRKRLRTEAPSGADDMEETEESELELE